MIAPADLQGHERSHQRPEQAAFHRLVFADQRNNHGHRRYDEGQQGRLRDAAPLQKMPVDEYMVQHGGGVGLRRYAKDSNGDDLERNERDPLFSRRRNNAAVAHEGERQQVERQQQGNGLKDGFAHLGRQKSGRIPSQSALGQNDDKNREEQPAALEVSAQQQTNSKDKVSVKTHEGGLRVGEQPGMRQQG